MKRRKGQRRRRKGQRRKRRKGEEEWSGKEKSGKSVLVAHPIYCWFRIPTPWSDGQRQRRGQKHDGGGAKRVPIRFRHAAGGPGHRISPAGCD